MKPTQPTSINGLEFDALISIDKNLEATVPQYSVEDGFSVSDAIIISPVNISMVLYVTNTPVTWASRHGVDQTRVNTVCKRLEEIFMSHDTVTVVTPDEVFTNMAITSLTLSKNAETGNYASEIPISLVKVYVTKARTTTIPDSYGKSGTTGAQAGTASTSTASSGTATTSSQDSGDEKKASILYKAATGVGLI